MIWIHTYAYEYTHNMYSQYACTYAYKYKKNKIWTYNIFCLELMSASDRQRVLFIRSDPNWRFGRVTITQRLLMIATGSPPRLLSGRCGAPSNCNHYNDVIMDAMASQITSLTIVYSTVYSDAGQRKHQSSASLAFVWGIHRNSQHKWPVTGKKVSIWWRHHGSLLGAQMERIQIADEAGTQDRHFGAIRSHKVITVSYRTLRGRYLIVIDHKWP